MRGADPREHHDGREQSRAKVAALAFGGCVVVWQDLAGTAGDIRARVYDSLGTPYDLDFLVTSPGAATANSQGQPMCWPCWMAASWSPGPTR